jgi:hypothetical protein
MSYACTQVLFIQATILMSMSVNTTAGVTPQQVKNEWHSDLKDAVTQGNVGAMHMLLQQASNGGLSAEVSALGLSIIDQLSYSSVHVHAHAHARGDHL